MFNPHFDRVDVCEAWYAYLIEHSGGQFSHSYKRLCALLRIFSPGLSLENDGCDALSENGKLIYDRLYSEGI